ncbi:MAG: hypothetical protein F2811_03945 [Actinobacteria bacterium]|nr:hypothetical protein [Actinomycetota bacterium]
MRNQHFEMYDRTIRRRRLTLAALLACSLLLLTVYFGESSGGALHNVQRGVFSVFAPIQEGASTVLKPARDLVGWVGDTIDAKGRLNELESSNQRLRARAIAGSEALRINSQLEGLLNLDNAGGLAAAKPVTARVIGQSPTVWYSTVTINQGSNSGIRTGNPVINGDGLIGQVSTVTGNAAIVTLISDGELAVPARISAGGAEGIVQAGAGGPDDLRLKFIARRFRVDPGAAVVTAGTLSNSPGLESLYPPGIPIGSVTRVVDPGTDAQKIYLRSYADLQRLEIIQVLTTAINGNRG